jgi:uncharacterized protein
MTERSRGIDLVKRLFQAVEARDLDAMFELYAEDVVIREDASLPYGGEYRGHSGVADHGVAYLNAWTPVQTQADERLDPEFLDCGDQVVVRWTQRAHTANGEQLEWAALSAYRVRAGRIVESQMFHSDTASIIDVLQSRG